MVLCLWIVIESFCEDDGEVGVVFFLIVPLNEKASV